MPTTVVLINKSLIT